MSGDIIGARAPSSKMESSTRHQPGPWRREHSFGNVVDATGAKVVLSDSGLAFGSSTTWPHGLANSTLCLAAPELLDALKLFFAEHDNTYDGEPMSMEMARFIERGRAAIAKAEGRAP